MTSPAAAQVAKNYTEPGSTYGPQYPEGTTAPGGEATPNALPTSETIPGQATGQAPTQAPGGIPG